MSLWFTNNLHAVEFDDADDYAVSSPVRFNLLNGESKIFYRLTPDTLAWIEGMLHRANAKHFSGGLTTAKLLELHERHLQIKAWATKNFSEADIKAAMARGGGLPVEPAFSFF